MLKLWIDVAMLAAEAQQVMWLRTMRIAAGGAIGTREAQRMVVEKAVVGGQVAGMLATGGKPAVIVRTIRSKVRANKRRMSR